MLESQLGKIKTYWYNSTLGKRK